MKRLERFGEIRRLGVEIIHTQRSGQAVELANQLATEGVAKIYAAGGDGTIHEVLNGIVKSGNPETELRIVPLGSANDLASSLQRQFGLSDTTPNRIDVGEIEIPGKPVRYFGCALGVGLNGCVTLESRKIRFLQGLPLYALATIRAVLKAKIVPTWKIRIGDEPTREMPTRLFSLLLASREGNFTLAPNANHQDGLFDLLHVGKLNRMQVLMLLPRVALFGPPKSHPALTQRLVREIAIETEEPLVAHADGEMVSVPEEGNRELRAKVLPGRILASVARPS